MAEYFKLTDSIYDITEKYPVLIDLLAAEAFPLLKNPALRQVMGRTITLESALRSKQLSVDLFAQKLRETIRQNQADQAGLSSGVTAPAPQRPDGPRLEGVLPCPIRIPLLDQLETWLGQQPAGSPVHHLTYQLQAASLGLDKIIQDVRTSQGNPDQLADLYLSAGFELFFDHELMGQYCDRGAFGDLSQRRRLNPDLQNARIDLQDPLGQYAILGVVPAVFMVNTKVLGQRPFPQTWADLLRPEFEHSVALPTRDLDLFNALLLHIHRFYGAEGVTRLGRAAQQALHPAQMVKGSGQKAAAGLPAVSVTPYFFTRMIGGNSPLQPVWPQDGAIVSPIFMLAKASAQPQLQPLVDFFCSRQVGETFSANGKFPSTHPEVDNQLQPEQDFMWLGWDYIHQQDITRLIRQTERLFYAAQGKDSL